MDSKIELKPCPFCPTGGRPELFGVEDEHGRVSCAGCRDCGSSAAKYFDSNDQERIRKAVDAWNRRADAASLDAKTIEREFHKAIAAKVPNLTKRQQGYVMGALRAVLGSE
ncbi:MAG TPA: Lar family restriction alleviation protein [Pyrinomonadaceae bacterium]|nr:Lar family restriction alleviation protein [Pyrinomonadaceae bacterium]